MIRSLPQRVGLAWARLSALATALFCLSCSEPPLAVLEDKQGDVSRDFEAKQQVWTPAERGARFDLGDAVHTAADSNGVLEFDDGARLRVDPSSTIRFARGAPNAPGVGLSVEAGSAVLESGNNSLAVQTQFGPAVLDAGAVVKLALGAHGLRISVSIGTAHLDGVGGPLALNAGQGVEVGIGMAIVDRFDANPPANPTLDPSSAVAPAATEPPELTSITSVRVEGRSAAIKLADGKSFAPLAAGTHQLTPGTQLRLGAQDHAVVEQGNRRASLSGPGTYVMGAEGERLVEPLNGSVTLSADGSDNTLAIPGGSITALGSQMKSIGDVRIESGRITITTRAGRLAVHVADEHSVLEAGQSAELRAGQLKVQGRGIGFFDVSLVAGGGLVVHDPSPPTAVRVDFGQRCPHVGIVEQDGKGGARAVGSQAANLRFNAGTTPYQLRCLSADGELGVVIAKGKVTIVHDAGTAALPTKAPSTVVATDGRAYTILYQNLLPTITVQWPGAPPAPKYTLTVNSPTGSKTLSAASPNFDFSSGSLGEGTHTLSIASSSGRTSRVSTAVIRFDNAAPKAVITSPAEGGFTPGQSTRVAGLSLPGWQVLAQGNPVALDSEQRFSTQVTAGERGLVLQFAHPTRGNHIYLRRATGVER